MNFAVRSATQQDIGALATVELLAAQRFEGDVLVEGLQKKTVPFKDLQAAQSDGLLWVAETLTDGIVGFLVATGLDGGLHISEMGVIPSHGRQGIGSALLRAAKTHARDSRIPRVTLTTFASVPWNAPFYAKHGFTELASTEIGPGLRQCINLERTLGLANRVAMSTSDA